MIGLSDPTKDIQRKIDRLQKKILKIIDQILEKLSDITASLQVLVHEVARTSEDNVLVIRTVDQFVNAHQDRINEIDIPREPLLFERIIEFSLNLKNLIKDLTSQYRVWLPMLRRSTSSLNKANVRKISYQIKRLHEEWINLEYVIVKWRKLRSKLI